MDYKEMERELSRRLKKSRYEHSLGVADTAAYLARRFGEDEVQARLAGLLHDCARAIPNEESYVNGLRLNFGWGSYKETNGLDLGLFSAGDKHAVLGINVFGHYSTEYACGWEIGLVNVSNGTMAGLQTGLVNYADTLYGVQIGLINIARTQWSIPIINICW